MGELRLLPHVLNVSILGPVQSVSTLNIIYSMRSVLFNAPNYTTLTLIHMLSSATRFVLGALTPSTSIDHVCLAQVNAQVVHLNQIAMDAQLVFI